MLGALLLILVAAASPVCALPHWGNDAHGNDHSGKDKLNPYSDGRKLTFKDGKFKLVVFSDLHFGERDGNNTWADWGVEQDQKSAVVMNTCLDDEKPDFVVFNGDQITGENTLWENSTKLLDEIFEPVRTHKTPFATVYGNHDESYNISHAQSFWYEKTKAKAKDLSWSQINEESSADPKGQFNYYIPVYEDKKAKVPSLLLWMFDSRAGTFNSGYFGVKDEPWMTQDWVDAQAATWINATAKSMKETWGVLPPSLVYVHIPPSAVVPMAEIIAADPDHPGISIDGGIDLQGQNKDKVWKLRDVDMPFWHAVSGTLGGEDGSGLLSVTSGHDHGHDWCERDPKVGPYTFCFARHTGYGGYGNWARGSRVVEARLGKGRGKGDKGRKLDSVKSWIRLEDHSSGNTTILMQGGKTVLKNTKEEAPQH